MRTEDACCLTSDPENTTEPAPRIWVDGIVIDPLTMREVIDRIAMFQQQERSRAAHVVTVNAQFVQIARQRSGFGELIMGTDLSVADGVPLLWASRLLGTPLPERINGTDLMVRLCEESAKNGGTVYFLGGMPGAGARAAVLLQQTYSGLRVAGVDCPPFGFTKDPDQSALVAERVACARPDIVFVALGAPKQEYWIERYRYLPAKVMIGVGGSFELVAGFQKRAPLLFQKAGCEWLWRLYQEPGRLWKRYAIGNTLFIYAVLWQKLRSHRPSRYAS